MKLKQFQFALVAMMLCFAAPTFAQEAKIGNVKYSTLKEAVDAASDGASITLLKNVTLTGGYDNPDEALRIEDKSVSILGSGIYTIDCGECTKGIRIYNNTGDVKTVTFNKVSVVNNNAQGRCVDTRTGNIDLLFYVANLTATGTNSQPLTIGGNEPAYRVRIQNGKIDAGNSGYGVICFVPVQNGIHASSNVTISGLSAFYLKEGTDNTQLNIGQGTYVGTNNYPEESGSFGTVVLEGTNNQVILNNEKVVLKSVASSGAPQAVFNFRGEGNTVNFKKEATTVTEGANASLVMAKSEVAASSSITRGGKTLAFVAECEGELFVSLSEAVNCISDANVKLLADVTLDTTIVIESGKNVTLDLNGKTVNAAWDDETAQKHIYAIDNKGTLNITGNGTINARGIFNYGAMTLENGTINAIDGNGGYGVRNYAGATFTMNGGTIATTLEDDNKVDKGGYDATPVRVDEGATFTMNGGVINNICDFTVAIDNHGTTIIKDGEATTVHTTLANHGTMTINGGEFTCNGLEGITAHAVWAAEGTTNISGGTFNGKDNYNGFNVDASEGAVVNITGGTFLPVHSGSLYGDGTISVSGGTFFDQVPAERCAEGYAPLKNADGTYGVQEGPVQIGDKRYKTLQAAIDAVNNGETITLVDDVTENVTLTEKVGLYYTIDGAGKTMNGTITVSALSDTNDNRRITIKNINFVDEDDNKSVDFISSANTNHYPRLTIEGCTFTGTGYEDDKDEDVAIRLKSSHSVIIKDCTGTGLHSFLQNTSGWNLTVDNVTVTNSNGGLALGTVQGVTVKNSKVTTATYGIRIDADTYNNNAVIESNNVTAFIPVVVRKVNTQSNVTITGENTFTASNEDGKWMVIGKEEYEENGKLPAETAEGNVVVALNDANLTYAGVHGAGLAGAGTAEAPYLINNIAELEIFRNSVNAGSAKYSKPGLCVALGADIDMAGVEWTPIGNVTYDSKYKPTDASKVFSGVFNGNGKVISNLKVSSTVGGVDTQANVGLFGITGEGAVIKDLTLTNVNIETDGRNVGAIAGFAYKATLSNITVNGNIQIKGGNNVAGIAGMTRYYAMSATDISVIGNDGSAIVGNNIVGGIFAEIAPNGSEQTFKGLNVENVAITGVGGVGGIVGLLTTGTVENVSVKNVALTGRTDYQGNAMGRIRLGSVAGLMGSKYATIANETVENVTAKNLDGNAVELPVIGANYDAASNATEAKIGKTYYNTLLTAVNAAKAGETVTLLADLNMSEILVLDKAITLDGNGKKLTSTAGRAINVDCEGNVGIKNLTINASGERAINVIQKPANVTIDNVTATAANYTVNLAGSAANAVVAVKNSDLTGLNVVNVAAAGAQVTVDKTVLNCADNSDYEKYAALALNKDAQGGSIIATEVTFNIAGDSRKATNQAENGTVTIDGSTEGVEVQVAYISYGNTWYGFATIEAAIAKANDGETIEIIRDITSADKITVTKSITINGNGKTLTYTGNGAAARAIDVPSTDGVELDVTIKNLTVDCTASYCQRGINYNDDGKFTLDNVTVKGVNVTYAVNLPGSADNAEITIKNSDIAGNIALNVWGENSVVNVENTTLTAVDNSAAEGYATVKLNNDGTTSAEGTVINITGGKIDVTGSAAEDTEAASNGTSTGAINISESTVVNGNIATLVAVIRYADGNSYSFETLPAAIEFAKAGETVALLRDVTVAEKITIAKSITLDGNGKKLTYTGTDRAIDVPNDANANLDVTIKNLNLVATTANRGLNYNENGKFNVEGVTVTIGENVDGYAINFPGMADNAQVTIKNSKLTSRNPLNIWGENMVINVYDSEIISVDNSTTYDYAAIQLNNEIPTVGPNGAIANGTVVNVYGGTITALNDEDEPSNVVANATETGVVNISDETVVTGKVLDYVANIGGVYFGSLQAAVNAIEKYGYNSPIVIMKSFATSETATVKNGLNVTIDLAGKTITVTDNTTKNFEVIKNQGTLTIKDSSADKTGKITVTATTNSGWNRYSAVIANTVGGKLTVEGGTLEHLGGTDMAYGIDNLTNGKGTYAETIINGGTIKSTYRAIRQFLNGTEAQNILTINGGTVKGANKSVWMQDPNTGANTGTLTVDENAELVGDVYLYVTPGSTEWPVELSIAADALQGESKVMTGNVPAGYDLAEVDGTYGVFSGIAKIGTTYYNTLTDAIVAVKEGETIVLIGNIDTTGAINIPAGKKLVLDLNGKTITGTDNNTASYGLININSGAELTINDTTGEGAIKLTATNNRGWNAYSSVISNQRGKLVVNGGTIEHLGGTDMAYGIDNLTNGKGTYAETIINGGTIKSTYRAIRQFLNGTEAQNILTINGGTIEGANKSVWMQNANANANPGALTVAEEAAIKGDVYVSGSNATEWPVAISVANEALKDGAAVVASKVPESIVIVNNNGVWGVASSVASANGVGYASLAEAVTAAADGATVTLLADITMTTKDYVTITDGYATLVAVKEKAVTLDLNGKNITVNASADDLTEAKNTMLMSVFGLDTNGKLTIIDSQNSATVTVNANDATVYSIVAAYGEGSKLTINGGTFNADKVGDSMLYSQYDELVTINGGSFILGNVGTGSNGKPWLFNGKGQNTANATVYGGTFNADVNHQFWAHEVVVPETLALKDNGNGTWTVVPSVAYNVEIASGYERMVGYATFEDAFAATNKYNCKNNTVVVVKDVAVENTITVPSDVTVVLDLNGKVLSMNDASGKGAYAIKNQGNLTIADNSEAKTGKITFNSTTPDNSFGYATSTIGNAGQLTVNSGTIENTTVGGASYAIDGIWHTGDVSLTINGGTIVANKIAVRQVPFSATAKNVVTVKGGTLTGAQAGLQLFNINNDAKLAEVNIHGGVFNGTYAFYTSFTSAAASDDVTINIDGGEFNGYLYLYNGNNGSHEYPMTVSVTGGTFNGGAYIYTKDANGAEVAIRSIAGGTFANNVDEYCAVGYICKANDDNTYNVVVNPEYGNIAQIGNGSVFENQYFATLNEAAQAAQTGDVIKLIADVNISAAGYATVDEENQYSTMMAVKEKDITLDMNGKTITVTPTADEVADAEMQMLMSVFGMDTNGKLTITGNGTVKVVANGTQVYSVVTAYGEGSLVTIENGNFEADKLMLSGSLFYSQQSECIIVNGGNFSLGNLADPEGQNGQPWIFNTKGQNYTGAIVNGGTFPTDINHQFWAHEVYVPDTLALKANENGTWTVVPSVAYTTEKASSRGSYFRNIGYASIEDAIAATDKYNCQNNTVTLIKDIAIETEVKIANGTTVVLDLNGKTIAGTDKGTASFGLITNKGDLTITDSSEEATGKITLTAEQNRGWNAYSSVISNTVGGKLTVNGGTIQHLGGTSMAWGIDNLTNGKGTYAETVINGGVVKSKYIAIRQFLNGVEADNILTVNGGTLEGETASLYFQDPSKNANTGTLNVLDGTLAGDVYLDVTAGSTEWPVEVYIAKDALGQNDIHADNVPADAAALVEYDTFWQVEQKNLDELTIEDACEEYINKIEKNVGVLTYERHFDDTEWQTIVLPFNVPVANLMEQFEVAYIYNASYKGKQATIDYVIIEDAEFVLAANYPYMIRAKEIGWNNIVVENAKLMPTEVEILDCSSIFEKFSFIGNYATVDTDELDAKYGYFNLTSGAWSKKGTVNPFRFYMQIELRNGGDFEYPTEQIRMRRVDENGNADTTGIDGVDAEQKVDFIFDVHGRRVLEPLKGQLYIINGKKVLF